MDYRGHAPGEQFVANLEPDVEKRALALGAIEIVASQRESIESLTCTPPREGAK